MTIPNSTPTCALVAWDARNITSVLYPKGATNQVAFDCGNSGKYLISSLSLAFIYILILVLF